MDTDKFKNDLMIGETSSIEFKRCGNEIEHDVFESICAFLDRFGGGVALEKGRDADAIRSRPQDFPSLTKYYLNAE